MASSFNKNDMPTLPIFSIFKRGRPAAIMTALQPATQLTLAAVILLLAARVFLHWDYVDSNLLLEDDSIYIGSYVFGANPPGPKAQIAFYALLRFLSQWGVTPPKILLLAIQSGVAFLIYLILTRFSAPRAISALLGAFIALYPIAPDQSYFMSGAHSTAGTLVFLAASALFAKALLKNWIDRPRTFIWFLAAEGALLVAAGFCSPTFTLGPALLVPATAIAILSSEAGGLRRGTIAAFLAASAIPSAVYFLLIHGHHYDAIEGWVDVSAAQVANNFSQALTLVFATPIRDFPIFAVALAVSISALLLAQFAHAPSPNAVEVPSLTKKRVLFAAYLLLASGLTFAPASVVTRLLPRYVAAPFVLGSLAIFLLLIPALKRSLSSNAPYRIATMSGAMLAAFCAAALNVAHFSGAVAKPLETERNVAAALSTREWSDDDQIVILLPPGSASLTSGFNHWSTWHLRVLTGKPRIIGLIGPADSWRDIEFDGVFVDKYADHGPLYWDTKDGRAFRKRMIGLERDRPLFVFAPNEGGELSLKNIIDWRGSELSVIKPGERPTDRSSIKGGLDLCSSGSFLRDALLFGRAPRLPQLNPVSTTRFTADGSTTKNVSVTANKGELTAIKVTLKAREDGRVQAGSKYGDTYPAMPLLGPDFAIYDTGDAFRSMATNQRPADASVPAPSEAPVEIILIGCPGDNAMLVAGDTVAGIVENASFSGNWTLGHGYLQRYWNGEIVEFTVARAGAPAPTDQQ